MCHGGPCPPLPQPSADATAQADRTDPAWRSVGRDGAEGFPATVSPIAFSDDEAPRVVPNSVGAGVYDRRRHRRPAYGPAPRRPCRSSASAGPLTFDLGTSTLPLMLTGTLWAGGRAGFSAAFIVHGILRRVGRIAFRITPSSAARSGSWWPQLCRCSARDRSSKAGSWMPFWAPSRARSIACSQGPYRRPDLCTATYVKRRMAPAPLPSQIARRCEFGRWLGLVGEWHGKFQR